MKILFLHGWHSVPGGVKPSYLRSYGHQVINPALDDDDFGAAVRTAQSEFDRSKPDVVVGSSRGGAVALNIDSGDTPLVLLCPAWKRWGTVRTAKSGTVVLHSPQDDVIPFAESAELVRDSGLPEVALVVVGTDHRLADPEPLRAMLEACQRCAVTAVAGRPTRDDYRRLVLDSGPVGYWPLRADALDASGYGRDGTCVGPATFAGDSRKDARVELDGASCVEVPSDLDFSQPTSGLGLSVEVWVRIDRLDFPGEYLHWLGKGEPGRWEWGMRQYPSSDPETPGRISAYVWNPDGGLGAGAYFQDDLFAGRWMHVVAGFDPGDAGDDGAGVSIWRDGTLRKSPADGATLYRHPADPPCWEVYPRARDAPLRLGMRERNRPGLVGGLAEVALYPRLLTLDEIDRHRRAGMPLFT